MNKYEINVFVFYTGEVLSFLVVHFLCTKQCLQHVLERRCLRKKKKQKETINSSFGICNNVGNAYVRLFICCTFFHWQICPYISAWRLLSWPRRLSIWRVPFGSCQFPSISFYQDLPPIVVHGLETMFLQLNTGNLSCWTMFCGWCLSGALSQSLSFSYSLVHISTIKPHPGHWLGICAMNANRMPNGRQNVHPTTAYSHCMLNCCLTIPLRLQCLHIRHSFVQVSMMRLWCDLSSSGI